MRILTAAERIVTHAEGLCTATQDFNEGVGAMRRAAFQKGGMSGADDVAAVAGAERIAEEVVGVLVANGFGDTLASAGLTHPGNIRPVSDFIARWQQRISRGQLETRRTR